MWNVWLDEAQAGIKIAGRNINNLRYADDTTLMAEREEELKRFLMKVKEGSEKAGLKLNTQKIKIMASGPITSWEIDGETVETVSDFIFWGSKITADGGCSHEIKRCLLLGRKVMTNLVGIFKSRDITLPTKVHLVKAMVFPVVITFLPRSKRLFNFMAAVTICSDFGAQKMKSDTISTGVPHIWYTESDWEREPGIYDNMWSDFYLYWWCMKILNQWFSYLAIHYTHLAIFNNFWYLASTCRYSDCTSY